MAVDDDINTGSMIIAEMKYGDIGFTLPSALSFDEQKRPYLDVTMRILRDPAPQYSMMVHKCGHGSADYDPDIDDVIGYEWKLEHIVEGANPDLVRLEKIRDYPGSLGNVS
jgi:hypothetical protein